MKEIEYIHSRITHYDDLSFKIKGWSITLWSGIVAFGANTGLSLIVLASIPTTLTFWIVDAYFKQYQRRSMTRMGVIEAFLDSRGFFEGRGLRVAFDTQDFASFPVHDPIASRTRRLADDFQLRYQYRTAFWRCFLVPNILYFYAIPLAAALAIAMALNWLGLRGSTDAA